MKYVWKNDNAIFGLESWGDPGTILQEYFSQGSCFLWKSGIRLTFGSEITS